MSRSRRHVPASLLPRTAGPSKRAAAQTLEQQIERIQSPRDAQRRFVTPMNATVLGRARCQALPRPNP